MKYVYAEGGWVDVWETSVGNIGISHRILMSPRPPSVPGPCSRTKQLLAAFHSAPLHRKESLIIITHFLDAYIITHSMNHILICTVSAPHLPVHFQDYFHLTTLVNISLPKMLPKMPIILPKCILTCKCYVLCEHAVIKFTSLLLFNRIDLNHIWSHANWNWAMILLVMSASISSSLDPLTA